LTSAALAELVAGALMVTFENSGSFERHRRSAEQKRDFRELRCT